jgi:hypothetical protein
VASIVPALIGLIALPGCDGRLVHLGDGRLGNDGGRDTGSDGAPCPHAQVNANEVLWTGDTWVVIPGAQHTRVRDLARAAGAIGADEDYVIAAQPASTMADIATQYDMREAGATKVKVLILDGGEWDTIVANGSDASVNSAVSAFRQHLDKIASDGTVEHVVYFLQPELQGIPGVAALRGPMQQACANSSVPCHFLDLQPLWAGHPEYTSSAGGLPFPSDVGAVVLADAIWAVMQQACVAQ